MQLLTEFMQKSGLEGVFLKVIKEPLSRNKKNRPLGENRASYPSQPGQHFREPNFLFTREYLRYMGRRSVIADHLFNVNLS